MKPWLAAGLAWVALASAASATCKLGRFAEFPVTMQGARAVVDAKINGQAATFTVDSGAFYSMMSAANAAKYSLNLREAPWGLTVQGVTGAASIQVGTARTFELGQFNLPRTEFLVGGSEVGEGTVGLLGQNFLRSGDAEYDLAGGVIRLFRASGCGGRALAYWAKPDQAVSVIAIDATTPQNPHTQGTVSINGVRLRAVFDTGAASSVLSLGAAARAGIKPDGPGVLPDGHTSGIGRRIVRSWIAPIASFKIGDEEVKNTRLRFAELDLTDYDILLGSDFFLAHRVYVATSQSKLYLTYNGGPVFNLKPSPLPPTLVASPGAAAKADGLAPAAADDDPKDAAGYSRRGVAFLARAERDRALADLTRAVELEPANASYRHERALAYLANQQPRLARNDLDAALKLAPGDVEAHVLRARMEAGEPDKAAAVADLDAAAGLAAKQDDVRLTLAQVYLAADQLPAAVGQFDLWIAVHGDDARLPLARNGRCWARALLGTELPKALADCNAAIRAETVRANAYDSRGLVWLRMGENAKAIADYDAALRLNPRIGWSLYGRGLAKLRLGQTTEAAADFTAATAVAPKLADFARAHGVQP